MLPASVIVVIIVFSLVFVGVLVYFLTLSSRIKHLKEKLDEKDAGYEDTQK
jgi:hypothetical protein